MRKQNKLLVIFLGLSVIGLSAKEYGDSRVHVTVLTLHTVLPAIVGGTDLGLGKLLYTLPAGAVMVNAASMSVAITQTEDNITADTPIGGLGTVIAVGAVTDLVGTGTFEDILEGQTFNDCDGDPEIKTLIPTAAVPFIMEVAAAHTIHFNVADGWAADGDAAAILTGTVVLHWVKLS